jgi:dTDP-4-dehydrorhamnose 3,5-epimerase
MTEMEIPRIRKHHKFVDSRGSSSRLFEINEMSLLRSGHLYILEVKNAQIGTVRGMHMQTVGLSGPKLLTVRQGSILDLCIDMRNESPIKGQIYSGVLSDVKNETLVIPAGFLHGYQVLEPNTEVVYALDEKPSTGTSNNFKPTSNSISHCWPLTLTVVSDSDLEAPDLDNYPGLNISLSQITFGTE